MGLGQKVLTPLKGRVLVVEDNESNQEIFRHQLESMGLDVIVAINGIEGLEILNQVSVDLILTDLHMPKISGDTMVRLIRKNESGEQHIPIIGVTADATMDVEQGCFMAGMDQVLLKPATRIAMYKELSTWLSRDKNRRNSRTSTFDNQFSFSLINLPVIFDPKAIATNVRGNPSMHHSLLEKFVIQAKQLVKEIFVKQKEMDMDQIALLGQKLHVMAETYGAIKLSTLCIELEKGVKKSDVQVITDTNDRINSTMQCTEEAIKQVIDKERHLCQIF